ncbi:MAG: organomercurial lyase [Burkholderiales bacterium]
MHEVARRLDPLFPALDEADQRLSLAIYRKLARGAPVDLNDLFSELGIDAAEGVRRMQPWPGVYYDSEQRVIGYWGLSLAPMRHRLRVGARELYAWCAWDTLFLPAVLGTRLGVASSCQATGEAVRLAVDATGVESAEPPGVAVSFVVPDSEAVRADVITSFCHYVHFFASEKAAAPWLEKRREAFLLSLRDAFEVGRLLNRRRYGTAL